jgi:DNA-binding response OmpR family regulator
LAAAPEIRWRHLNSATAAGLTMSDPQARNSNQGAYFGEIFLDFKTMEMRRAGQPVHITLREFKVLKFLVSRPRIVISRQKLISCAWPKRERASFRTVDNCIAKLRHKIESNPSCPVFIQTVHGVGYKFLPPEDFRPLSQNLAQRSEENL